MKKHLIPILFIASLLFTASCNNEETYADLFTMTVNVNDDGVAKVIKHEAEATLSGEQQYVKVTLQGDFDDLKFLHLTSNQWTMVTSSAKSFCVQVLANNTGAVRNDYVEFVVTKGSEKTEGILLIIQQPNPAEK